MISDHPPAIIEGGMGIAISDWKLARAVSMQGQLGVVSGTGLDTVLVRRLQDGDLGGHVRRAIEHFPLRETAAEVIKRCFRPAGRPPGMPYVNLPMHQQVQDRLRNQITMLGTFVEVHLARHGHDGSIGINLLTKVQLPNLASLYGAMLAGVDYVLMGAGIPRDIPAALAAMARHRPTTIGRKCLCNALFSNIGLGQVRSDGSTEPALLTSGDDLKTIGTFLAGRTRYRAADVIRYLLGGDDLELAHGV